jgi:hypothetical protein
MACMEHFCTRCSWTSFSNDGGPAVCPKCGAPVNHAFDEEPDDDDE